MTLKHQLIALIPLAIIVSGLLGYNLMSAQWAGPTATAPGNNTEAPINISSNYQAKIGDLGAIRMRAGEYCNADGTVCFNPATVNQQGLCPSNQFVRGINSDGTLVCATTTAPPPAGRTPAECTAAGGTTLTINGVNVCRFNGASCPATWQQYQAWSEYRNVTCGAGPCGQSCTTGLPWGNNTGGAPPQCMYTSGRDTARGCDFNPPAFCNAPRTQIGCI